jgi:glycosyltransferase involved in cell wall biosynthesis
MKILLTNFHARNGGGHVTYIVNLLQGLVGQHTLTVATPKSSRLFRYAQAIPGVQVVDMHYTTRPASWFGPRAQLRRLIQEGDFDIVHVNGSADHKQVMLALFGMWHRPKVILTKHNEHAVTSFGHHVRARWATDRVIAVSDDVKQRMQTSAYRRCGIVTVRHGIDTDFYAPVCAEQKKAAREKLLGSDFADKIVLGSAGGTDTEKGWLDLVQAVGSLEPHQRDRFHLIVAGDLPNQANMAQVAQAGMTGQMTFPGLTDDVRSVLAACDAGFVLSYQEALSFACRELMSMGLPVLVTRVGGLPENLDDGVEGWMVPVRSPAAIADVLKKILADTSILLNMGQAARRRAVNTFNLPDFVAQTLSVYQHS